MEKELCWKSLQLPAEGDSSEVEVVEEEELVVEVEE